MVAAALALGCAPARPVRLLDLGGDQPAIFGLAADPESGVSDLLRRPAGFGLSELDALAAPAVGGVRIVPQGGMPLDALVPDRGAELAVLLRDDPACTIVDVGSPEHRVAHPFVELADIALIVLRGCYLALRRAVHSPLLAHTQGAIAMLHPERPLGPRDIGDVLQLPVLASLHDHPDVARAVDAGVLPGRCPPDLARIMRRVIDQLDIAGWGQVA